MEKESDKSFVVPRHLPLIIQRHFVLKITLVHTFFLYRLATAGGLCSFFKFEMPPFVGHVAPLQSSEKMALRVLDLVCMTDEQSLLTSAAAVMPQTAAAAAEMPPNEPQSFKG